jgi:hypothetical protein
MSIDYRGKRLDDEITQRHTQMMQSLPAEFDSAIARANQCTINGDDIGAYMNIIRAQMIKSILDQKPL